MTCLLWWLLGSLVFLLCWMRFMDGIDPPKPPRTRTRSNHL